MVRRFLLLSAALALTVGCESGAAGPVGDVVADADGGTPIWPWGNPDSTTTQDTGWLSDLGDLLPAPEDPCVDPVPGGFCAPCESGDDCESGFCVWTPAGKVCTVDCLEECPVGFTCELITTGPDQIYACLPGFLFLCDPCSQDDDCNVVGMSSSGKCLEMGPQGSYCSHPCDTSLPCPDGFTCVDDGDTSTKNYCRPIEECECSPYAIDQELSTQCASTNDYGTCVGSRVCAEEGLSACDAPAPAPETCNGIDDDCNGSVDDGLGTMTCAAGTACEIEIPACVDGLQNECDPDGAGTEEVCNGLDDDCDGAIDEGLGTISCGEGICKVTVPACVDGTQGVCPSPVPGAQPETCNGLDDDCDGEIDEGTSDCTLFYMDGDQDGYGVAEDYACLCQPADGHTAMQAGDCKDNDKTVHPGAPEVCNNQDDNCNQQIDEGLGVTTCGLGQCEHQANTCVNGVPQACNPLEGAMAEVCNGVDDDCDGQIDDDLGSTTCGQGKCFHVQQLCENGQPQACNPYDGATPEVCNGQDDDCDGMIDDGLGQLTCGQGKCFHQVQSCLNGVPQVCDPFQNATPEVCNGQDDDCDGQIDEGLGSIVCGQPPCSVTIDACVNGVAQQCGNVGNPQPEMCDGLDNDCDGQVDEENAFGCKNYYADKDNDGWGADNDFKCLCQPTGVYQKISGGDCYDQSKAVYPGNQSWYTVDRGDGLYDYNCDGLQTLQFSQMFYCNPSCTSSTPGWYGFMPQCGQKGVFATVCVYFMICDIYNNQMVAACN